MINKHVFIVYWNVYGECENLGAFGGHTNAITDLQFSTDGATIYTASADKTIMCWDTSTGTRIKKLKGILRAILIVFIQLLLSISS